MLSEQGERLLQELLNTHSHQDIMKRLKQKRGRCGPLPPGSRPRKQQVDDQGISCSVDFDYDFNAFLKNKT